MSILAYGILALLTPKALLAESAAWHAVASPTSANIVDIWGSSPTDIFAVTSGPTDFLHYDGVAWSSMACDSECQQVKNLLTVSSAIWGVSGSSVFVVGTGHSDGVVAHWDGEKWETINGAPAGTIAFYDIWGTSDTDLFVADKFMGILHYNGTSWTQMTLPVSDPEIRSIWGNSSSDVFAIGFSQGREYVSILHYDGSSWKDMLSVKCDSGTMALWGASPCEVFSSYAKVLYYNGIGWSPMKLPDGTLPSAFWGKSSTDVFAVGGACGIAHYNGKKWRGMESGTTNNLNSVWGSSSTDVWAVGDSGTILHFFGDPPEPEELKPTYAQSNGNGGLVQGVATATGEYAESTVDISLGGPIPLYFSRYYASYLQNDSDVWSLLGKNWTHNFDTRLLMRGCREARIVFNNGKTIRFQKNGENWELISTEQVPYQLVESDSDFRLSDPSSGLIHTFDRFGKLTKIEDRNGNAHTLEYFYGEANHNHLGDWGDYLYKVSDGLKRQLIFDYKSDRSFLQKVQWQFGSGYGVEFDYADGNLTEFTDLRGHTTSYAYTKKGDLEGLMESKTRPKGNTPFVRTYNAQGGVATQKDSENHTTTFSYDSPSEGMTTITDPLQKTVKHKHDSENNLVEVTDPDQEKITLTYDSHNRLTSTTDQEGYSSSITYDEASGQVATRTDPETNTVSYTYKIQVQDDFTYYDLERVNYPDETYITMSPDDKGNITSASHSTGKPSHYLYNDRGQVTSVTNPAGGVTLYEYDDKDGTLKSVTDHAQNTTSFKPDTKRRLYKMTHPDETYQTYLYDDNDNLTSFKNERGFETKYGYDKNNNLTSIADPLGYTEFREYDDNDRLKEVWDPKEPYDPYEKITRYDYDERGLLKEITTPINETTSFGYNAHGWLTSIKDPGGYGITINHDKRGALKSIVDPMSQEWQYTPDKLGRIKQVTTPLSHVHKYEYDNMGRPNFYHAPDATVTKYDYGSLGLLKETTIDPPGDTLTVSASCERNDLGQIKATTDPKGSVWEQGFDQMGRPASETDPLSNQITYDFDEQNRIFREELPLSEREHHFSETGHTDYIKLIKDGDVVESSFTYDDKDRLTQAGGFSQGYDAAGRINESNGIIIRRYDDGRIHKMTLRDEEDWCLDIIYEYNDRGLVEFVKDHIYTKEGEEVLTIELTQTFIGYNARGQVDEIHRPHTGNDLRTIYGYDGDGTLSSISDFHSDIGFARDKGRIVTEYRQGPGEVSHKARAQSYSYDRAHQMKGNDHDALGRVEDDKKRVYDWDLADRLRSYTEGEKTVTFVNSDLHLMTERADATSERIYFWNYAIQIPSVSIVRFRIPWVGLHDVRYYVHLPSGWLLHSIEAANHDIRRYYHYDQAGTTWYLTDQEGTVTDTYNISPYGEILGKKGDTENPFTYMGAYGNMQEGDTGLYYMRGRWYDSKSCRFLSRSNQGGTWPLGLNPYVFRFGLGNPWSHAYPGSPVIPPHCIPRGKAPSVQQDSAPYDIGQTINMISGLAEFVRQGLLRLPSVVSNRLKPLDRPALKINSNSRIIRGLGWVGPVLAPVGGLSTGYSEYDMAIKAGLPPEVAARLAQECALMETGVGFSPVSIGNMLGDLSLIATAPSRLKALLKEDEPEKLRKYWGLLKEKAGPFYRGWMLLGEDISEWDFIHDYVLPPLRKGAQAEEYVYNWLPLSRLGGWSLLWAPQRAMFLPAEVTFGFLRDSIRRAKFVLWDD